MTLDANQRSVDDLNLALGLYRRLLLRLVVILVGGFAGVIALSQVSTLISPPYGVYILGMGLVEWGLIAVLVLLAAEFYRKGQQIGQALDDGDPASPPATLLSGLTIIAQRANAMGMEWSGFLGPLRPVRRK